MKRIINDSRPIRTLVFPDTSNISVGKADVQEILPYEENGEMASVIWFMIIKNKEISQRVNGKFVDSIIY